MQSPWLRTLILEKTDVTDDGFRNMDKMKFAKLKVLGIANNNVSMKGLKAMVRNFVDM